MRSTDEITRISILTMAAIVMRGLLSDDCIYELMLMKIIVLRGCKLLTMRWLCRSEDFPIVDT